MMGEEIEELRGANIPRALLVAGVLITALYILGTVAMLVTLPHAQILNLDGFMRVIATGRRAARRRGVTPVVADADRDRRLGQAGAWFAASGRLPFVAGIDRFLPAVFGRIHPRYNSPYVSLLSPGRRSPRCSSSSDRPGRASRAPTTCW